MMAAILNSAILNFSILDSAILVFPLKLTLAKIGSHHLHKENFTHTSLPTNTQKNFTHSFWLNLMIVATLNSAILNSDTAIVDSETLLSSLRFTQKHSHSTLTLTQTNSIWLKLIHSPLTWWWQPSWILPSWIQPFFTKNVTHSFWLNLMMAAILNSAILDSDTAILDSDTLLSSLSFTKKHSHSTLTLTQSNSNWLSWWWQPSWILPSWIFPSWIQPS